MDGIEETDRYILGGCYTLWESNLKRSFTALVVGEFLLLLFGTYLVESSWLFARRRRRGPLAGAAIVVGGSIGVMAVGRVNWQFLRL